LNEKKVKILHVTSSLKVGGAETVLCDLIEGLDNNQFEHHVVYFHYGPKVEQLREAGVPLYHIKGAVGLYDPLFFVRLFRIIKWLRPDCIHSLLCAANVSSRVIARLLSVPHISVYHNNIDQDGMLKNMLDRLTRQYSDKLVAVSRQVAHSMWAATLHKAHNLTIIPNGIDAQRIQMLAQARAVSRKSLNLPDNAFVFGSVGRFCPVKNYPLLLESFARVSRNLPQAHLVLVGMGPDEQELQDKARQLNIAIKTRFVIGQPAYGYYPLFDCFVQSSDKEGVSMALLEAMSCGIPCIATGENLKHSVLAHGQDGLIVRPGDAIGLSVAMDGLVNNLGNASLFGKRGQKSVQKKFDKRGMVRAYKELFVGF